MIDLYRTKYDGSTGETNVNGYNCLEIAVLTSKHNMPVSVYTQKYIQML